MRAYTQSRPLAAQRVHRGAFLSHRRLPLTQALQLFWRVAALLAMFLSTLAGCRGPNPSIIVRFVVVVAGSN